MPLLTKTYPWVSVFRTIVARAQSDPDVNRLLGEPIRSWDGSPADKLPMTAGPAGPILRMTPFPQRVTRFDEISERDMLDVRCELAIQTTVYDDVFNFWGTLCDALSWRDEAFRVALKDAGAEIGEIEFTLPMSDPQPAADPYGSFFATGVISIALTRTVY